MMICPHCGKNTTFATVAHVAQDWEVDGNGDFVRVLDECTDVIARPNQDNIWTCMRCGAEAVEEKEVSVCGK